MEDRKKVIRTILSGEIVPIQTTIQLKEGEQAYFQFRTERRAEVEYMNSHTTGTERKKGVVGRAMVGDLVFGKAGAIIGGVTADSTINSFTKQERSTSIAVIDNGVMLFTNKRLLFLGKDVVSISYDDILMFYFPNPIKPHYPHIDLVMEIKYPSMLKNESYTLSSTEIEMYFKGILRLIEKDKTSVTDKDVERYTNKEFIISERIIVPINADESINCPECDTVIKEYREGGRSFILFGSRSRDYICPNCLRITCKSDSS